MPRLPAVSYKELLKLLNKLGYDVECQRGSHIRMKKQMPTGHHSVTVPAHREIAKGTLSDILDKVSIYTQVSKDHLIELLRGL